MTGLGSVVGAIFFRHRRRWTEIGSDPHFRGRPLILNEGRMMIGSGFRLSSMPVRSFLSTAPRASLEIGENVSISHGSELCATTSIKLGNDSRLGAFVMIIDSDYHVVGRKDLPPPTSPIAIGRNVRIGNAVTILRGTTILDDVTVRDGSVVSGYVEAGTHVSGHYRGRKPRLANEAPE